MADVSDVEAVLVAAVAQALYPDGTGQPSVAGVDCRIYRGWPLPQKLDADLAAGKINVSVFPLDNERRTTRYSPDWQELPFAAPHLNLAASNNTITVTGTPSSPLNAAAIVDGVAYVYPVQPGDTLASVAAGLAATIDEGITAYSSGATITIPAAKQLAARVGTFGKLVREIRRQKRSFQIGCWCHDPGSRDAAASAIDAALAAIDYLSLPDGTAGRLLYEKSRVMDGAQREGLYRRDLVYSVEYATTQSQGGAQIVVVELNLADARGRVLNPKGQYVLLEDGGYLLMEDGTKVLRERQNVTDEDGSGLLMEDGDRIILE